MKKHNISRVSGTLSNLEMLIPRFTSLFDCSCKGKNCNDAAIIFKPAATSSVLCSFANCTAELGAAQIERMETKLPLDESEICVCNSRSVWKSTNQPCACSMQNVCRPSTCEFRGHVVILHWYWLISGWDECFFSDVLLTTTKALGTGGLKPTGFALAVQHDQYLVWILGTFGLCVFSDIPHVRLHKGNMGMSFITNAGPHSLSLFKTLFWHKINFAHQQVVEHPWKCCHGWFVPLSLNSESRWNPLVSSSNSEDVTVLLFGCGLGLLVTFVSTSAFHEVIFLLLQLLQR